jgi:PhnB protein
MANVKPIPESYPRVSPHLSVAGAPAALDFYTHVFAATERMRMAMPDGRIAQAEIDIGGSAVMVGDEVPGGVDPSPKTLGGSPVALFVYVEDVEDVFKRAIEAGAKVVQPPKITSTAIGSRCSTIRSDTGGISPRISKTSRPKRWSDARPRQWPVRRGLVRPSVAVPGDARRPRPKCVRR